MHPVTPYVSVNVQQPCLDLTLDLSLRPLLVHYQEFPLLTGSWHGTGTRAHFAGSSPRALQLGTGEGTTFSTLRWRALQGHLIVHLSS